MGEIPSGAYVLDIGCGAGVDALLAALQYAHKLLKPGGKLLAADRSASQAVSKDLKGRVATWFQ